MRFRKVGSQDVVSYSLSMNAGGEDFVEVRFSVDEFALEKLLLRLQLCQERLASRDLKIEHYVTAMTSLEELYVNQPRPEVAGCVPNLRVATHDSRNAPQLQST